MSYPFYVNPHMNNATPHLYLQRGASEAHELPARALGRASLGR